MAKQQPIEIPVKLGIADIRKQLKVIQGEIANTFDPEEIARLSERAGELKDNLIRVNEQVAIYSSGSPFEQSANALGLVGSQLASLDFEGAAESAQLLQSRINSITPEHVTKQIKGLTDTFTTLGKVGGTAITGMLKNVGALAKAFLSFGASLLMNPIFLLVGAITLIVGGIALLMNKLGLLKPVIDAIGKAFEFVGWIIDKVVQGFNDLTDWLGLTNVAGEKLATKQAEAAEKVADSYDKMSKKVTFALDEQIKMLQIEGKNTTELEIKKQEWILKTSKARAEAIKMRMKEGVISGELDKDELEALREKYDAQIDLNQQATSEIKLIKAKDKQEQKKEGEEQKKQAQTDAKAAAAAAKQYAADRLAAARMAKDIELENLKDGTEKELAINAEKYKRLIEDTAKNERLTAGEKAKVKALLIEQEKAADAEIKTAAENTRREAAAEEVRILAEGLEVIRVKRLEEAQRTILAESELAAIKNENDLTKQLDFLEKKKIAELSNTELLESEKALIEEKYRRQKNELEEAAAEKEKQRKKDLLAAEKELLNDSLNAAQSISDLVFLIKKNNTQKGSAEEEKNARKQFNINKGLQVATASMSATQAVLSALAQPMLIPAPLGTVIKAGNVIAAGATGLANVGKIAAAKFEGGGNITPAVPQAQGAGGGATSGAAAPSLNMFGNSSNFNNTGGAQGVEMPAQNITVNAVVAQDQITAAQILEESINNSSKL